MSKIVFSIPSISLNFHLAKLDMKKVYTAPRSLSMCKTHFLSVFMSQLYMNKRFNFPLKVIQRRI